MVPANTLGYFSLIQYCPDPSRLEAANVGVVLYAPAHHFLKAITARDNRRIRKFFGREGHDWGRINSYKRAIEEQFVREHERIKNVDDLARMMALAANRFRFTPPRPMTVKDPTRDLDAMFRELVGGEPRGGEAVSFPRYLGRRFSEAGLFPKLRTDIEVTVPSFDHRQVEFPFGYQNGRFNLIKPARFLVPDPAQAINTACRYAVEGRSLYDAPDPEWGALQLVVVGRFPSKSGATRSLVEKIFEDNKVRLFSVSEQERLIAEIRQHGKPVAETHP